MNRSTKRRLQIESLESRQMLDASSIVISEVMYNGSVSDSESVAGIKNRDLEFIEFFNAGAAPATLTGATINDAVILSLEPMTLQPGEYAVAVGNTQTFVARYGTGPRIVGQWLDGTLGNGGDRIEFLASNGVPILDFTYDDAWYPATDGAGPSLVAVSPLDYSLNRNFSTSWRPSASPGGSPGYADGADDPRPRDLAATVVTSRHVELTWAAPASVDAGSYRVYRDGALLTTFNLSETTYTDATASPGSEFIYQVAIAYNDGREFLSEPNRLITDAVGGNLRFTPGLAVGAVSESSLIELSGLVASRTHDNVFWTHNDGAQLAFHSINADGNYLGSFRLNGVISDDWEDIAIGPGPAAGVSYVYIGDIGTKRNVIHIYRVPEPNISENSPAASHFISDYDTITLQFPADGEFNSETLLVDPITGDLFVIPKKGSETPIFRAAAETLTHGSTVVLEMEGMLTFPSIAGGDISATGSDIVIRNEDLAQRFARTPGQSVSDALLHGESAIIPVIGTPAEPNGEAISFDAAGEDYFTISEGKNSELYLFERISPSVPGDVNRDGQFTLADIDQIRGAGRFDQDAPTTWEQGDWNGDALFNSDDVDALFAISSYDANNDGQLGILDVDELVRAVSEATNAIEHDLSRDGVVDRNDLDIWLSVSGLANLSTQLPYIYGDANLDGSVDATDFNHWSTNRFAVGEVGWSDGDFNADGTVDVADFNVWNDHKFQVAEAANRRTSRARRAASSNSAKPIDGESTGTDIEHRAKLRRGRQQRLSQARRW